MAVMRLADALRNAMADQITALIDAGSGPGTLKIYSGTQPADADDALSGNTLLAELALSDPSAPAASSGVLTLSAIADDASADATGTATWARVEDSDGNNVFDCDVTDTGGTGTLKLNTTSIVSGGSVSVSSFTVTGPAG